MTKINRLSIHGFKSFANKTEVYFDDKYNCILGPNGSGKSNVGDALCFVLGRLSAKSMRAEKSSHLLFNGGKNKKPVSTGYVEIAFDNTQKIFPISEKEVVVNRTITKDGNSIYRLNGKKLTRQEVLDVLAAAKINPNGYNIILQGDITHFVDMPTVERRKIIEEISDVSVYEEKKHKALLELQKVEEQLNSAEIILKERKTHLKELKKDRDQALEFKELKGKIDSSKATFLHLQIQELEQKKQKIEEEIKKHQEKMGSTEKKIVEFKSQIQAKKDQITKINQEIEQKGEKEQVRVHKDIEDLKVGLARDKTRMSTIKDEITKVQQRKDQFRQEIRELEDKASANSQQLKEAQQAIKAKQREQQDVEQKITEFKKKNKIEASQDLDQEIEEKDKLIEKKQEEIQQLRQKQQESLREKDKLEFQVQTIDEKIRKVKEVEQENKQQVKELQNMKNEFKTATLRLNQCLDQDSGFSAQLGNARKKLVDLQEQKAKADAKTQSVLAHIAGNEALKALAKKKMKGVFGTIAELGQVNKKYSLPLEVAAGNKTQHVVVEDDQVAAECIKFLQQNKSGTASFIPLNKIKYQEVADEDKKLRKQQGVHDFAIDLISFKPQFKKAFAHVFGNTLVVENIETARNLGVGRIRMATMDGNQIEFSGVMKGGYLQRRAASFQEKDALEEADKMEKEIANWQAVVQKVEVQREANEREISQLRLRKGELEGEIITLEKTLHLGGSDLEASAEVKKELQEQLKKIDADLALVNKDITALNKELADLKTKKQALRDQITELRNPRLLAQLTAFEELKHNLREEMLHLENQLKNSHLQVEQLINPELEKIKEIIKQHDKEEAQFSEELRALSGTVKEREKDLEKKEKESKDFYAQYKELFNVREKLSSEISRQENDVEGIREKSRDAEREVNMVSLENAELKAKVAGLQEEFNRYKDVPLLKEKKADELKQEMAKFEVMLSQMSAVNMKALEIYEQVEQEYTKLLEKMEKLGKEKTDVLAFMNEVETKKKDHFLKTFEQANQNFQRIFTSLFKKGNALLQLDNPQNPFEDGVSIKVKITGNRYLDLKSLSGGEKTLTALSFIFAMQEFQPASFYILDEIDAALDKHNSETLAKLIRSYADRAQYLIISHNDSVISEADTLYGVSMTDGVSKVTSLRI
ncbi:chromosome segregation protein SMC [Candidatus Woesearchaeota archaeon]|nr:chromosome segregation protein SMC [Candidatus Woesearchaeota archaeon]